MYPPISVRGSNCPDRVRRGYLPHGSARDPGVDQSAGVRASSTWALAGVLGSSGEPACQNCVRCFHTLEWLYVALVLYSTGEWLVSNTCLEKENTPAQICENIQETAAWYLVQPERGEAHCFCRRSCITACHTCLYIGYAFTGLSRVILEPANASFPLFSLIYDRERSVCIIEMVLLFTKLNPYCLTIIYWIVFNLGPAGGRRSIEPN